jgi:hypothetical protein
MLALRAAFAVSVMALVVWLLIDGLPFGALAVVLLAVWVRRSVEAGRLRRVAGRFAHPS